MMRKEKICILMVYFFSILSPSFAQVSLQEVLVQVREKAPETTIKELIAAQSDLEVKNAGNALKPQFGISGQATYQSEVTFLDIDVPGIEVPAPDKLQYKIQGEVNQILYDGGMVSATKEAALLAGLLETSQVELQLEHLRKNAIELYFSILEIDGVIETLILKKEDLASRKEQLEAGVREGVILESELFQLRAAEIELDQQVLALESQKNSLHETLAILRGAPPDEGEVFVAPEPVELVELSPATLAYYDILDSQANSVEARQKIRDAASRPKLSAFGNLGLGRPGLNFLNESLSEYYIVGVRMQMQFSNLYSKGNDRQLNRIKKEKIEKSRNTFDRQWQSELVIYQNDLAKYDQYLQTNLSLLELRSAIKEVAQSQLDNGVITTADYIERLNEENEAMINLRLTEIRKLKTNHLIHHHTGNYSR